MHYIDASFTIPVTRPQGRLLPRVTLRKSKVVESVYYVQDKHV